MPSTVLLHQTNETEVFLNKMLQVFDNADRDWHRMHATLVRRSMFFHCFGVLVGVHSRRSHHAVAMAAIDGDASEARVPHVKKLVKANWRALFKACYASLIHTKRSPALGTAAPSSHFCETPPSVLLDLLRFLDFPLFFLLLNNGFVVKPTQGVDSIWRSTKSRIVS